MTFTKYQQLASRTAKKHDEELINYGLGLSAEAGEVADLIKKFRFHGHKIYEDDIKKELGDVLWYASQVARVAGIDLGDVAESNIAKLKKRYPHGFSSEDSIKRVDVKDDD
ncbi:nucleotide pyrophosphohydrolase [Sporolactobacillus shoreae]|uniref:Nucleotide pyrophosphohydrolase n=1 Tax=Sporolactobacillus shoreae TaxID=1465501 RepID=A0A4Z0GJU6_9BACL|nr:nucleoside triphosphate pyrophosphohydrolase family protein [Sporolactobacillus shoreae]TGA95656.1 nucleotide pyrophosphohydrolase [Sporolactobacillus shoreae]